MCGIIGIWNISHPIKADALQSGLAALKHRGPDDHGVETFQTSVGQLVFGHTRLSIIDLSSAGHQPMYNSDGSLAIVFNGEIYNYLELRQELRNQGFRFKTDTDTEVLLACWAHWGMRCLPKLRGMFAFVVYDRNKQTLTCVRDPFGIKPFFYHHTTSSFGFASEIPALLCLLDAKPNLNLQRSYDYLIHGNYDDQEATFFAGIKHLPAAHCLELSLNPEKPSLQLQRWWWPDIRERTDLSFTQAAEQLREIFLQNIRLHLRSDVPFGAALSGGLDSSAVVCAIRHLEPDIPIHTFSYIARGSSVDEEQWVDQINRHVGAIPHKINVSADELARDLDDMIQTQGEPFGSTSIYAQYRVFQLARDNGITVTLDGQGADELLAGYHGFPGQRLASLLDGGNLTRMATFLNAWAKWPGRSIAKGGMSLLRELIPLEWRRLPRRWIGHDVVPTWIDLRKLNEAGVSPSQGINQSETTKQRRVMATLRHSLSGGSLSSLLRHGDRNSMRWSIESRVPFLTTDIAEFLLRLPEDYLISAQGETKHVFRAAMRGIVPDDILNRRDKIGFATPEQAWLGNLEKQVMEWVQCTDTIPFLHPEKSQVEIQAVIKNKKPFSFQAWRLINLIRWAEVNFR